MKNFQYLKAYFSPFKPLGLNVYFGKTAIGTPYFLPRRWVKPTAEMAIDAAIKEINSNKEWNERNPNSTWKKTIRSVDEVYQEKLKHQFPVPKRIGFDFVDLGWKTKWSDKDIRFEWSPMWSFVFFGYQIAITFVAPEKDHYWECWLYYELHTDKTKSKKERIAQCREEFPCRWICSRNGVEETVDYYERILRKKYLK